MEIKLIKESYNTSAAPYTPHSTLPNPHCCIRWADRQTGMNESLSAQGAQYCKKAGIPVLEAVVEVEGQGEPNCKSRHDY